jgi:hypothetical protein
MRASACHQLVSKGSPARRTAYTRVPIMHRGQLHLQSPKERHACAVVCSQRHYASAFSHFHSINCTNGIIAALRTLHRPPSHELAAWWSCCWCCHPRCCCWAHAVGLCAAADHPYSIVRRSSQLREGAACCRTGPWGHSRAAWRVMRQRFVCGRQLRATQGGS